MSTSHVKGTVLRTRLAFVEDHAGKEGLSRVFARLKPADAESLRNVLSANWYAFELSTELDRAVVDELGGGRPEFFLRLGAESAERNLGGVHKAFIKDDPHQFLAQVPSIHAFYYDRGHRTYERSGERQGVMTTHEGETFSATDCLTIVGWHTRALELCGATGVQMVEDECRAKGGQVCRYVISWQSP